MVTCDNPTFFDFNSSCLSSELARTAFSHVYTPFYYFELGFRNLEALLSTSATVHFRSSDCRRHLRGPFQSPWFSTVWVADATLAPIRERPLHGGSWNSFHRAFCGVVSSSAEREVYRKTELAPLGLGRVDRRQYRVPSPFALGPYTRRPERSKITLSRCNKRVTETNKQTK